MGCSPSGLILLKGNLTTSSKYRLNPAAPRKTLQRIQMYAVRKNLFTYYVKNIVLYWIKINLTLIY